MPQPIDKLSPYNAPGMPFGNFGDDVSPAEADQRIIAISKRIALSGSRGTGVLENDMSATFRSYDAPALPPDMPDLAILRQLPVSWLAARSPQEVAVFRRWMEERYNQQQEAIDRDRHQLAAGAILSISGLRDQGYLPGRIVDEAEEVASTVPISPLNSFEAGARYARAICWGDHESEPEVNTANLYDDTVNFAGIGRPMAATFTHEILHALLFKRGAGFVMGMTEPGQPTSIVEETGVTHVTMAADSGEFEQLDPATRSDATHSYTELRSLMATIGRYGRPLEPELLIGAQISPLEGVKKPSHPRRVLADILNTNTQQLLPEIKDEGDGSFMALCAEFDQLSPRSSRRRAKQLTTDILKRQGELTDTLDEPRIILRSAPDALLTVSDTSERRIIITTD
jgi:hypothetical protein